MLAFLRWSKRRNRVRCTLSIVYEKPLSGKQAYSPTVVLNQAAVRAARSCWIAGSGGREIVPRKRARGIHEASAGHLRTLCLQLRQPC
jgi:hypothetical protein